MTIFLTHWRLILEGLALAILSLMLLSAKADVRHYQKLYEGEKTARALEQAEVRRVRAEQTAADQAHARKVEQVQAETSQEISREYQTRLADLRSRYDSLRAGKAQAVASGSGGKDLPGLPITPGRFDVAAEDYAFRCEADAIQLESLIGWVREQEKIER